MSEEAKQNQPATENAQEIDYDGKIFTETQKIKQLVKIHSEVRNYLPFQFSEIEQVCAEDILYPTEEMTSQRFDLLTSQLLDNKPKLEDLRHDHLLNTYFSEYNSLQRLLEENEKLENEVKQNIQRVPEDLEYVFQKCNKALNQKLLDILSECQVPEEDNKTPEYNEKPIIDVLIQSGIKTSKRLNNQQNEQQIELQLKQEEAEVIENKEVDIMLDSSALLQ